MRHRKGTRRLGRQSSHRKATMKSMARAIFLSQSIKTTKVKAKEARVLVDNLITLAKKNTPHHQRVAFSIIPDKKIIKELFKEIGPRFQNRTGGYTRIIPLNFRKGDGASMVILELTEKKIIEKTKVKKALDKDNKAAQKKAPIQKQEPQKAKKETTAKAKADEKPEAHQIAPKPKAVVTEKIAKEKGKAEKTKIQKGFMKGLRGFFRSKNP